MAMGEIASHDNSMPFSPLLVVDAVVIPSETLSLSILKLDASSFRVDVAKAATVAELRKAVEAAFSHMPRKGPGKVSWAHVWGQFCLCYGGRKLVTETDFLRDYGIKDGDQLHFVRHLSDTSSFQKRRLKKRVFNSKQGWRSLSQVNRYQQLEHSEDDNIGLDDIDIENGNVHHCHTEENCGGKNRLTSFLGGLFSYTRLAVVLRAGNESRICPSLIARVIVSGVTKIRRILHNYRRQHYFRRDT